MPPMFQPGMFALSGQQQPPNYLDDPYYKQQQQRQDQMHGMLSGLFSLGMDKMKQPFDYSGAPKAPGVGDFSADRQRIEQELLGRAKGDLDLFYQQKEKEFEQAMANQGVDIGSERYQREKGLWLKGRDQAYNDARFRAIEGGGSEQNRLFGLGMEARRQAISEADALRDRPLKEMRSVLDPALQYAGIQSQEATARRGQDVQRYGVDVGAETSRRGQDIESETSRRGQDVQRYGIDIGSADTRRGQDVQRYGIDIGSADTRRGQDVQRYGIDIGAETTKRGQDITKYGMDLGSQDTRRGQDIQRYGIDVGAETSRLGRETQVQLQQMQNQNAKALQEGRIDFDRWAQNEQTNNSKYIADQTAALQKELQAGRLDVDMYLQEFKSMKDIELQKLDQLWQTAEKKADRKLQRELEAKAREVQREQIAAQKEMQKRALAKGGGGGKKEPPINPGDAGLAAG